MAGRDGVAEGEAKLRAMLESTSDSVFILGPDWRSTFLNRRAFDHIADGRDLLGQVAWEAFPEAVGGPLWQACRRCMAERVPAEAEQFYEPLGRWFAVRAVPAADGGIAVFFRDGPRNAGRPSGCPKPKDCCGRLTNLIPTCSTQRIAKAGCCTPTQPCSR